MALVQQIETIWSKESRSAGNAKIRNSVPEFFEAPDVELNNSLYQFIKYDENNSFKCPEIIISHFDKNKLNHYYGALRIFFESNMLKIVYTYSPEKVGAPTRTTVPRTVLSLKKGEWGRIIYTGRFCGSYTGFGDWFYRKVVFNIANIEEPKSGVFSDIEPTKTFYDIKNLR